MKTKTPRKKIWGTDIPLGVYTTDAWEAADASNLIKDYPPKLFDMDHRLYSSVDAASYASALRSIATAIEVAIRDKLPTGSRAIITRSYSSYSDVDDALCEPELHFIRVETDEQHAIRVKAEEEKANKARATKEKNSALYKQKSLEKEIAEREAKLQELKAKIASGVFE